MTTGDRRKRPFCPSVANEMIVPYMKRVTDFLHSKGKHCNLHSCGQLMKQVPNIIAAGWDSWGPQAMNDTHKIYDLFGDKLLIGVMPDPFDPETSTEEEHREAARRYADRFCNPQKPSYLNLNALKISTPAFWEELYRRSRMNYSR